MSSASSRTNSTEDLADVLLDRLVSSSPSGTNDRTDRELKHEDLKKAISKRDGVWLFCWGNLQLQGAHIIAQKNDMIIEVNEETLFDKCGLKNKHEFDTLKRYVDVVDDKLVVKVVNESNNPESDKHKEWEIVLGKLKNDRLFMERYWSDGRQAVEESGEMALYFVLNNTSLQPNRMALEFHKVACLIWRMAGGAESEEEYCSDDNDLGLVDTAALKRRFKIQDSSETLNFVGMK